MDPLDIQQLENDMRTLAQQRAAFPDDASRRRGLQLAEHMYRHGVDGFYARPDDSTRCITLLMDYSSKGYEDCVETLLQELGAVVLLALFVVPLERVFYSVLAAVVMGVFLWISHRPGRYVGG